MKKESGYVDGFQEEDADTEGAVGLGGSDPGDTVGLRMGGEKLICGLGVVESNQFNPDQSCEYVQDFLVWTRKVLVLLVHLLFSLLLD